MSIVKSRKIFYAVSGMLVVLASGSLLLRGLNLGVDFKGDARIEITFADEKNGEAVEEAIRGLNLSNISITIENGRDVMIRTRYISEEEHQMLLENLQAVGEFAEKSFVATGPSVGRQLRRNALIAILISLAAIIMYIAFVFRQVSRPVPSWVYGLIAIAALAHDVLITTGVFSYLRYEIDALFISALLTVIGFSVHDTIVVFDRVREHLRHDARGNFEDLVERSLRDTIVRSINTSVTILVSLFAIYFFGGGATQNLALALIIGIGIGTYSSIFIASPLLVTIAKWLGKA